MLPSTVRDLKLARCSLTCHSLLGLLSPGTQLDSLEIDRVNDGFVITLSSHSADKIDIWHELNSFHSFRQQVMKSPPPASLQQLKINFSPFIPQGTAHVGHQHTYYQPEYMQELLIMQLFHVPEAQRIVRPYLQADKHFPVYLKLSSLVELDLCVGPFIYCHVQWGWAELSNSLTTLTIRDCDLEFYDMRGSHAHLPLSGLCVLEHVKLVAPVCSIRRMLWSVISWTASAKELTTATLDIVACISHKDRWILPCKLTLAFMWRILVPSWYTRDHQFGGSVHFSIASRLPRVLLNDETNHLSQLCNSLAANTSVKAIFMSTRVIIFPEYIHSIILYT
ncbi:hypothetical protein EDD18DRAFT_1359528 [Armillaria luteobubalina]|uniref:Uncharacterized protein n=1 Tax=Armillaria luteobubalina TaxID=153913 RepID=A0AA39UHY5_9AGAR|nr:hypothetical protein EDD18DRAFT_1359528 [Armillaria luteobubalina]